jgi:hypothetical protein
MPPPFEPTFRDLEKDIERHLERFGKRGSLLGSEVIYGLDQSRRIVFDAYVAAGANDAITTWLTRDWNYIFGTSPFFDETIERFRRERAASRLSRLWRHVCAEQIENYRILQSHRDLEGVEQSSAKAKQRALASLGRWRDCLIELGDQEACRRLDEEIADFEAGRRKRSSGKPDARKIDADLFWEIIAAGGGPEPADPEGGLSTRVEQITIRLATFSATQIKAFDKLLWEAMQRLNHWDVWAMAYLLQDGCSDDAFEGFRAWVILQGRQAAGLALTDPLKFLDQVDATGNLDGSALLHGPAIAFDRRTGKTLRMAKRAPASVQGTPWEEEAVETVYPLLAARITFWKNRSTS